MEETLLDKFHRIEARHWWWEGRRQLLRQLLDGEKIGQILDVGCGTGETMNFLDALIPNCKAYGVDASPLAVKYAKGRGHKKVYLGVAEKLPFKANFFDAVLFLDVLEHIEKPARSLKEAKRVVKKGGIIIVSCPAMPLLWSDHDTNQGHVKRYQKKDFDQLAAQLDLKIEWAGYFNFFLFPVIAAVRWMSRVRALKFLGSYENGANYNVAEKSLINLGLRKIFVTEVKLARYIRYPWGVSVAVKMRKI